MQLETYNKFVPQMSLPLSGGFRSGHWERVNPSTDMFFREEPAITRTFQKPEKIFKAPIPSYAHSVDGAIDTSPIQIWEGRILEVDEENSMMKVLLSAKIGVMADHTADIELQWVAEQDRDLVIPGAVFYLSLFKQLRRGSVQNSQELRFRRLPAWTSKQLADIKKSAALIRSKLKARPQAE